jgi:hypothetical protein
MTNDSPQSRWQWRALLVVALTVLATLSQVPTGARAASHDVRFSISDNVTAEDESYVREGISLAEDYLRDTLDAEIDDDLVVNVRDTADPSDDSTLAFANDDFLVVFTGSPYWDTLAPFLRMETVIHEYVHIYQFDALGDSEESAPMWLIEGMAEYLGFDAMERLGVVDHDAIVDYQAWAVLSSGYEVEHLEDVESVWDYQSAEGPVYSLSYLAVSRLFGELPSPGLERYIEEIQDGATWQEAFPDAFGVEADEFYAEFDAWMEEDLLAPRRIPTAFREIYPVEQEAPVTILSSSDEILPGDQAIVLAETERGSACSFTLRDENGERVATMDTFADRAGVVFWLVTIPEGSLAGNSEVMVDCGDQRDRVKLQILAAR